MSNPGFKTKKSLGQNFLKSPEVIEEIARASGSNEKDTVVEIGPGLGVLTDELCKSAGKLVAVELDDRLIPILRTKFALRENVSIVHEDILSFDWSNLDVKGDLYIVGNLPYYITTPILLGILEKRVPAKRITVMVQKEVADRIVASPGGKDYGVLSISLQYYAKAKRIIDVPSYYFEPAPKVDSAVVSLDIKEEFPLSGQLEKTFFAVVKKAFSQRRKTLLNSLSGINGMEKDRLTKVLESAGIDPKLRAENLSVEDYIRLCKEIENA